MKGEVKYIGEEKLSRHYDDDMVDDHIGREFAKVHDHLAAEFSKVHKTLHDQISQCQTSLIRWMFFFWITQCMMMWALFYAFLG